MMLLTFFITVDSFSFSSPGPNCKPWLVAEAALEKPAHGRLAQEPFPSSFTGSSPLPLSFPSDNLLLLTESSLCY